MSSSQNLSTLAQTPSQSEIHKLPARSLKDIISQRPQTPISTSIANFDHCLSGGIIPGQIYEIYGLNGVGKSSFTYQICHNALKMGKRVLWISCTKHISLDKLEKFAANNVHTSKEYLQNVSHIRITTFGQLFLYLQTLKSKHELLIIDDLAIILNKCYMYLESRSKKSKLKSIQRKKTKAIQDLMKLLSAYCIQNKAASCLINNVDILNMSFIDTKSLTPQHSTHAHPSSGSFHGSQPQEKRKFFYQPILVSALGDHPSWSSFLRARIMFYKDWVTSSRVATFARIVHNPSMLKILKLRNFNPKPVMFDVGDCGLLEVQREIDIDDSTHSFILENDGEVLGTAEHVLDEDEYSDFSDDEQVKDKQLSSQTLLPSSPFKDIRAAKDLLPSSIAGKSLVSIQEEINQPNFTIYNDPVEPVIDDGQQPVVEAEEDQSNSEQLLKTKAESNSPTNTHEKDEAEVVQSEEVEQGIENGTTEHSWNDSIIQIEAPLLVEDPTLDFEEIEGELEELYPTQPESLNITQLSQLDDNALNRIKRPLIRDLISNKKAKFVTSLNEESFDVGDADDKENLDSIPASAPMF